MFGRVRVGVAVLVAPPLRVRVPILKEMEGEGEEVWGKGVLDPHTVAARVGALDGLGALPVGEEHGEGNGVRDTAILALSVGPSPEGVLAKDAGMVGESVPVFTGLPLPVTVPTHTVPVGVAVVLSPREALPTSKPVAVRLGVQAVLYVVVTLWEAEVEGE